MENEIVIMRRQLNAFEQEMRKIRHLPEDIKNKAWVAIEERLYNYDRAIGRIGCALILLLLSGCVTAQGEAGDSARACRVFGCERWIVQVLRNDGRIEKRGYEALVRSR